MKWLRQALRALIGQLPFGLLMLIRRTCGIRPHSLQAFEDVVRLSWPVTGTIPPAEPLASVLATVHDSSLFYASINRLSETESTGQESDENQKYYLGPMLAITTPKHLYSLPRGRIIGPDGLVYDSKSGAAVLETSRHWIYPAHRNREFYRFRVPPIEFLPGIAINLTSLDASGFYHLLIDVIPKLHLVQNFISHINYFVCSGTPTSFHLDWYHRAGIPKEKIKWVSGFSHFECERLLFTNRLMADSQPTAWIRDAIRSVFKVDNHLSPHRLLWISRSDSTTRSIRWERDLLSMLPEFECVHMSALSPNDQINLAREAKVIAGPHGAGLSNLVFANSGGKMIELFDGLMVNPCFQRLALTAGWKTAAINCSFDIELDPSRIAKLIRSFISLDG